MGGARFVEVLRLHRSDICEMDVRADWARMAKRSGRGCSNAFRVGLPAAATRVGDRDKELQPHLLQSKSGGLHTDSYPVLFFPAALLGWDTWLEKGPRGIYFESMSRADATVETKPAVQINRKRVWGLEIRRFSDLKTRGIVETRLCCLVPT